jgi:hypothetical protein
MRSARGKRLVWALSAAAAAILLALVYVQRQTLLETWHLHRLDNQPAEELPAAIARLGKVGGVRSVDRLFVLTKSPFLIEPAVKALAEIAPRLSPARRGEVVANLKPHGKAQTDDAKVASVYAEALLSIGKSCPDTLPLFLASPEDDLSLLGTIPALLVLEHYRWSREQTFELLLKIGAGTLRDIFAPFARELLVIEPAAGSPHAELEETLRALAFRLSESHAAWEARAIALSFRVARPEGPVHQRIAGWSSLAEAYARDPDPQVGAAALRIAGWLGPSKEGFDLRRIVLEEEDAALLAAAIEARTLWASADAGGCHAFEIYEGELCHWLAAPDPASREPIAWSPEEISRLEAVLASRGEPALRDAASRALALRYRGLEARRESPPEPLCVPGFRAAEWGVWEESSGRLDPPQAALDELPAFVHRSEVRADELQSRVGSRLEVLKPVVFFESPTRVSALFRVRFQNGRPWTFYPRVSDVTGPFSVLDNWDRPALGLGVDQRLALEPPWLRSPPPEAAGGGWELPASYEWGVAEADSLAVYHHWVPWLRPRSPRVWTVYSLRDDPMLADIGLEWCGLRIGYPAALEAPLPAAADGHWWSALRQAGGALAGARGESERFVFYDGALAFPGPAFPSWADASRQALRIAIRSFDEYPDAPAPSVLESRWWLTEAERERARERGPIPALLVVEKRGGADARGAVLESLLPEDPPRLVPLSSLTEGRDALRERLQAILECQGLREAEARSLLDTWDAEFFEADGLRLITVLPQWLYDALLPAEVFPLPERFVRVGVVTMRCDGLEPGGGG